jgi:hypothetical protein
VAAAVAEYKMPQAEKVKESMEVLRDHREVSPDSQHQRIPVEVAVVKVTHPTTQAEVADLVSL